MYWFNYVSLRAANISKNVRPGLGEPSDGSIYNGRRCRQLMSRRPDNSLIESYFDVIAMTERKSSKPISDGHDLAVEEARPKLKQPSMYRVILINDDYTPMEFVVEVLESIFGMERNKATRVMLEVHTKGKGICGVFTYEIAETKVAQVMGIAQQQQHPLLCTMEEL